MTVAAILETGFMSNPDDAYMLINFPEKSAQPLAEAIIKFLKPANDI